MAYIDKINPEIPEGRIIIRNGDIILKDESAPQSPVPLPQKSQSLVQYIKAKGYSAQQINKTKEAYGLLANYNGFRDVKVYNKLRKRHPGLCSQLMWWLLFDFYDILPSNRKVFPSSYDNLTLSFRNLLDDCMRVAKESEMRDLTISVEASSTATFLCFLQEEGIKSIYQLTETTLRKYSRQKGFEPAYLYRIGLFLTRYASAKKDERLLDICTLFPEQKSIKKLYPSLTKEERDILEKYVLDPSSNLSKRDRAVVTLLLFTGMRKEDVRELELSNIDWKNDVIRFHLLKSDRDHTIPLRPVVGNAIYDYIMEERPKDAGERLFVSPIMRNGQYSPVDPATIANRTYEKCGIRDGMRRGSHLLRHSLGDEMVNHGNDLSAVSNILGHNDPNVTLGYLSANIEQLRNCALDISEYPITHKLYSREQDTMTLTLFD